MTDEALTPLEIVQLYVQHTSNEGNPDWIMKLCADPAPRHDPNAIRPMSHAEQMDRIRHSRLRPFEP